MRTTRPVTSSSDDEDEDNNLVTATKPKAVPVIYLCQSLVRETFGGPIIMNHSERQREVMIANSKAKMKVFGLMTATDGGAAAATPDVPLSGMPAHPAASLNNSMPSPPVPPRAQSQSQSRCPPLPCSRYASLWTSRLGTKPSLSQCTPF
jgi:hypothetical protein